MNVTNTGQGELHIYKGQNIGVVDLRSAGHFHITKDSIQRCCMRDSFSSHDHMITSHSCTQVMKKHNRGIQDLT